MSIVEALLELQEVDGRIRELEGELKDLPQRKAKERARLQGVGTDLEAAKEGQQYANERVRGFESEAQTLKEKIDDLKRRQVADKSNRAYQQYSVQIDLLSHDLETVEHNQLAAMDDLPTADRRLEEAQSKFDQERGGVDALCGEIDERIAAVSEELAGLQAEREAKRKTVADADPKFLLYYERLRTKRWPVVVALTAGGVCDGCHLVQPPSVAQLTGANAKNGAEGRPQSIVACTMCGRMLYSAE